MDKGSCPVMAANYPACGCPEGECEVFDEFGMACDNCDRAGHREAGGWRLNADGSVWCQQCAEVLPPPPQANLPGDTPVLFGLEAQGHIPAVEAALSEGADWQEIGRRIGWDGETAKQYYERHLARKGTTEGQDNG